MRRLLFCLLSLGLMLSALPLLAQQDTTDDLVVTQFYPTAQTSVPTDSTLVVVFNRPVVPLVTSADAGTLPDPLVIAPAVDGTGEWVNTSIYQFKPTTGLAGGVTYTVTIPAGTLSAVDDTVNSSDASFTFTTLKPSVISISPNVDESSVTLTPTVTITFSEPVDTDAATRSFTLTDPTGSSVAGSTTFSTDGTILTFVPSQRLANDTLYQAQLTQTVAGAGGGTIDTTLLPSVFRTAALPAVISTDPMEGATDVIPESTYGNTLQISFNTSMDEDSLKEQVTIEPVVAKGYGYFSTYNNNYYLTDLALEPQTTYTVTVGADAADIYGSTLGQPFVFSFTTGDAEAVLALRTPGQIGLYNVDRPELGFYVAYRNVDNFSATAYRLTPADFISTFVDNEYFSGTAINEGLYELPLAEGQARSYTSQAAPNAYRFQFIGLADLLSGDSCAGAPVARVQVGGQARVVLADGPLRARTAPDGDIQELLYKDYALTVLDGPVCQDGLRFWQVQLRNQQSAWVAEGDAQEYFIAPTDVEASDQPPVLSGASSADLQPGIYYVNVNTAADLGYAPSDQSHTMIVATTALTIKYATTGVEVWASDLTTAQPVVGVPITLYSERGEDAVDQQTATTDAQGMATFAIDQVTTLEQSQFAVLDSAGQFGLVSGAMDDSIQPYLFGLNSNFYPELYKTYIYTDRPLYRPGQVVSFKGVVRTHDDIRYGLAAAGAVEANVTAMDYQGNQIYSEKLTLNDFGTFNGSIQLADDVSLGDVYISVSVGDEGYSGSNSRFSIAEFRTPEFQVTATTDTNEVISGDPLAVDVSSEYFFGGPVSNATLQYNVLSAPDTFAYTGKGAYSFTDFDYDSSDYNDPYGQIVQSGEATTDAGGTAVLSVPANAENGRPERLTIEATISDESNNVITGRTQVTVHPAALYAGIRSTSYVVSTGETATLELITVDTASQPIANQPVSVSVVRLDWSSVQETDASGQTTYESVMEEVPVLTDTPLTTDADGIATLDFVPDQPGSYKAYVTTQDSEGRSAVASTYLWVAGSGYVAWRETNSKRIELIADKTDYAIGETAQILIASPFDGGATALITVERGKTLFYDVIAVTGSSTVYDLPINAEYAPNVYVSVLLMKPADVASQVVDFRIGYVQLNVDRARHLLTLDIQKTIDDKPATTALPAQTVTYTITATDYQGQPVVAEISAQMVDKAVLSVLPDPTVAIENAFYGIQPLSVRTGTLLAYNGDMSTQEILDTFKGGGGGGGDGGGVMDIRDQLSDAPYWNAVLRTDANGVVSFDVTLPDNLTTWVLTARALNQAADGDLLVGQAVDELRSTKPLIIRPVTPRFFVVNDQVTLSAVVNNNTDENLTVDVRLNATGVALTDLSKETQTINVAAHDRATVSWAATVTSDEAVTATFSAESAQYADATISPVSVDRNGTLRVYRYEAPEYVGTAGVLSTPAVVQEAVVIPENVTDGQLDLQVDASLAAVSLQAVAAVTRDDDDCIACVISKMLINLTALDALTAANALTPEALATIDTQVQDAVIRLASEQKADGGWGWYGSPESDPVTTTYALLGLGLASEAVYTTSTPIFDNALAYVTGQLTVINASTPQYLLNRRAFQLYVLARVGQPDNGRTAALTEFAPSLSLYAKALLAQTLMRINPADSRAADLVSELASAVVLSAAGARWQEPTRDPWNWNTDTRTTAIVLQTLVMAQGSEDLLANAVRGLVTLRRADLWATLQETVWSLQALTDYAKATGELNPAYQYTVSVNDQQVLAGTASADTVATSATASLTLAELASGSNRLTIEHEAGAGALYYTARLRANLPVTAYAEYANGIYVTRQYTQPGSDTPVTRAEVGDLIDVTLTVIVPNDSYFVVVEDPLPAGVEAINPQLATSQQAGTQPSLQPQDPLLSGWGWWLFDNIEFRTQKVVLSSTYLPRGTYEYHYLLRATIPGVYNVIPTTAREFYDPDIYGRSNGLQFTVTAAAD